MIFCVGPVICENPLAPALPMLTRFAPVPVIEIVWLPAELMVAKPVAAFTFMCPASIASIFCAPTLLFLMLASKPPGSVPTSMPAPPEHDPRSPAFTQE